MLRRETIGCCYVQFDGYHVVLKMWTSLLHDRTLLLLPHPEKHGMEDCVDVKRVEMNAQTLRNLDSRY